MSNRSRAILYSTVIFLAGIVAGALLMNLREHLWLHPQGHVVTAASWDQADRAYYIEQIKTELQLTEAQSREMEAILDATIRQYHDLHTFSHHIREEGIASIRATLNDEQRHRFDEIVGKMTCPLEGKGGHEHSH